MKALLAAMLALALSAAACGDSGTAGDEEPLPTVLTTKGATSTTGVVSTAPPDTTTAATMSTTTSTTAPRPPSGPGHGGEAVIGDDQQPETLNPFAVGGDNFIVHKIAQAHMPGVFDVDGRTRELIPDAVTELPNVTNGGVTVNEDGTMTVRYQIRDAAVWADGVPISGDDLAFTLETMLSGRMFTAWGLTAEDIDVVTPAATAVTAKTFEMTLPQPTLLHEQLFEFIIPKHDVAGTDVLADWHDRAWVSGGPFVFESSERGSHITLVRNDNYWKTDPETGMQLPYLDSVTFRFIPETEQLIHAFKARDLDVISPPPWHVTIQDLQALEPDGASVEVLAGPIWEHLNFQFGAENRNDQSLNRHLLFRRAVAHALDRDTLLDTAAHFDVEVLDSYVRAFTPAIATDAWAQYPHDPVIARGLIEQLCAELERDCDANPPKLIFSSTSNGDFRVELARQLPDMLAEAGIDVELQLEDSSVFFGPTLDRGTWDVGLWAWVGSPGLSGLVSIHDIFDPSQPPPDGSNFYRWGTSAVTGLEPVSGVDLNQGPSTVIDEHTTRFAEILEEMKATVDSERVRTLVRDAERLLADQAVIIPLYRRLDPGAVWADEIAGYVHSPSTGTDLWNVAEWYRADR